MRIGSLCALVWLCLVAAAVFAQTAPISGHVLDPQGRPVAGAAVFYGESNLRTVTNAEGRFTFSAEAAQNADIRVEMPGFAPQTAHLTAGTDTEVQLSPATVTQNVVVTATRSNLPE